MKRLQIFEYIYANANFFARLPLAAWRGPRLDKGTILKILSTGDEEYK